MPNTNASFTPESRRTKIKCQLDILTDMDPDPGVNPSFEQFDLDTENILSQLYGKGHKYVEAYKYASVGEAEAMVNLPESAQEPTAKDIPKMALQQRRQVLLGILSELEGLENKEEEALTGEDREDPRWGDPHPRLNGRLSRLKYLPGRGEASGVRVHTDVSQS